MRRLIQLVLPCVLLSGCFGPGEGVEVPQEDIYFPVGLALSQGAVASPDSSIEDEGPRHLFVASSDFDLQYNGGAVQSFDLNQVVEKLPQRCVADSDCAGAEAGPHCQRGGLCAESEAATPCPNGTDRSDADRLLFPGRCAPIEVKPTDAVKIGAFATDAIIRKRPEGEGAPARLFVPVRGDSTLHWLDVTSDGEFECGQGSSQGACDDAHRVGDKASENARGITLNAEPFALDADARGETIVVTNQTSGVAALFTNDWRGANEGPKLAFELQFSSSALRPVGVAAVPQPASAKENENPNLPDVFLTTFRNAAQVRVFSYAPDSTNIETDPRPYLVDGGNVSIEANSVGTDSRGIAVDDSARKAAEARCAEGDPACLDAAALVPLDVYVANRSPSSLLLGRTNPPYSYPYFYQAVPLTTGPSRVVVGQVKTPGGGGATETRVFVACFESRRIFVYDPQRSRIETEILTGRGPHAMAVDTQRGLLYVGHFTDSYVGVFSLDLAFPSTYGTMLGTLGQPKEPRASK